MGRLFWVLALGSLALAATTWADILLKDEGVVKGPVSTIVCVGTRLQCSRFGSDGVLHIDGGP